MTRPKYGVAAATINDGLVRKGYGSCSGLARHCRVCRGTITRWRDGTATPQPRFWHEIETYLELEPETIAKLVNG